MPSDTRMRLVQTALERFYRDGFRNVGVDQILDDVGISKTAFYKHFRSKDELMLAALEHQSRWLQEAFRSMLRERGGRVAAEQLAAVFDVVGEIIERPDFQGCIFIHAAMEFPLAHDPAHRAAAANKAAIEEILFEVAERAGVADPAALARELCLIIDGTYVGRQVTGDPATLDTARQLGEQVIARHLPRVGRVAAATARDAR